MKSSPPRRAYDNRLREEHASGTRQRILAAVTALLSEGEEGITIASIAARAGVSEPTIYRHFGSRERLDEALDQHIRQEVGLPPLPDRIEDLPQAAETVFGQFEQHAGVLRAAIRAGYTRELRAKSRQVRHREMRELLRTKCDHVEDGRAKAIAAVYRLILSFEAWQTLTGEMEVSGPDAASAAAWAIAAMNEKLERDRATEARRNKKEGAKR